MNNSDIEKMARIVKSVCAFYRVSEEDVFGPSRKRELIIPRFACYFFINKMYPYIFIVSIGRFFKRDHASVLYGISKTKNDIEVYKHVKEDFKLLAKYIKIYSDYDPFTKLKYFCKPCIWNLNTR